MISGHAYTYPDSFCQCGAYFARPEVDYDRHLLEVNGDETQLPLASVMTNADTLRNVAKPAKVMRSVRVPLKLWEAAKAKADQRDENISDVIRDALQRYVNRK